MSEFLEEYGSQVELIAPQSQDNLPAAEAEPTGPLGRYAAQYRLGRGGMGQVVAADDPWLNRQVAIKLLQGGVEAAPMQLRRFSREAQVTAQLEHPFIVPVYDIGITDEGELFFAMRRITGMSLSEVVKDLRSGDNNARRRYTRARLLAIFQKVCMAVAYAHSRGVIHRDLKPANIMVGEHGEVYLMDWGLCRVEGVQHDDQGVAVNGVAINLPGGPFVDVFQSTGEGMAGTPVYMAPEHLAGSGESGSVRGDIYSLGAIMYELLTYMPLFHGGTLHELVARATMGEIVPPRVRTAHLEVPPDLEAICLKALESNADLRHESVEALHDEIEEYLEGTAEKTRRRAASSAALKAGFVESVHFEELLQQARDAELHLYLARLHVGAEGGQESYRTVYHLSQKLEWLEAESVDSLSRAARRYEEALYHDPDNAEARGHLARLYWSRFIAAEQRGDRKDARYFRRLVETYNDGQFDAPLSGEGVLRLQTDPPGVRVQVQRYGDDNGVMTLGPEQELGTTPLEVPNMPMGSYLVTLTANGYQRMRVPIQVERQGRPHITIRMRSDAEVSPGFVVVPGGPFVVGGDEQNPGAGPRRVEIVADFAISRFPVTTADYLDFINDLVQVDADAALEHVPRRNAGGRPLWSPGPEGLYRLPGMVTGAGIPWNLDWPVTHVTWHNARAYCRWMAHRLGLPIRLPTNAEWEKAGRGVDGRVYPWGTRFDPSYCNMNESGPGSPQPEAIGAYQTDESPYGVRDLAGGVAEWCEGAHAQNPDQQSLRGMGFEGSDFECRLTFVRGHRPERLHHYAGFRLAHDFQWETQLRHG
jgi:serine/threonine-protein kinase